MFLRMFQKQKKPFQTKKNKELICGKIGIFPKGLVHGWQCFYLFNIGKTGQENVFDNILTRKKAFLAYKNKKLKKWKNWDFFQNGYSMVLVKNCQFFYLIKIGKIGQENVFENILARKKPFPAYKNKKFKKSKN